MRTRKIHGILWALAALLGITIIAGCAPKKVTPPRPALPMSAKARLTYDYLVYQDQLLRLKRMLSMGSKIDAADVNELRLQAARSLSRVINRTPSPELFVELATLFWSGKDKDRGSQARAVLAEGLKRFPDNRTLAVYLANAYMLEGHSTKAAEVMDAYIKKHPKDHAARERLGSMLIEAGKYEKALDELAKLPKKVRTAETLYLMARAQGKLGMRKKAKANLNRALARDPEFRDALIELAYLHELDKEYTLAEKTYEKLLELGDTRPQVRLRLINMALKLNNPEKGLKLAMDGPRTKSFILDSALVFINAKFYAQASTILDVLASGDQIPAEYYFYKAVIAHEGQKDLPGALKFLDRVKQDDRFYAQALQFRAQLLNVLKRRAEALKVTQEGRKLFPEDNRFYLLASGLYSADKQYAEALKVLDAGLKMRPGDPELMYEKGVTLEAMGRRNDALAVLEKVLAKHPDNAEALNFVGYTLAEEGRDLERALVLVSKALQEEPGNGYILDSVAWVHFKLGDFKKAWDFIRQAVTTSPKEATIWEHYGDIAARIGDAKEARKGYEKALKLKSKKADQIKKKLKAL